MPKESYSDENHRVLTQLLCRLESELSKGNHRLEWSQFLRQYFDPLKHHGVKPSHPLYDIAFYLMSASILQERKAKESDLVPLLEVWSSFSRPNIWVFHAPYIVPEFWSRHFKNKIVKDHFTKYFEAWIERVSDLTWNEFASDLQVYFTHLQPRLTESQFSTLVAILQYQTDSVKELGKKLSRSEEAVSRDKRQLYEKKAIHKSVWIDFPKIGLQQKTLILFHQPAKGFRALISSNSPWIYSRTIAYLLNRYSIFTFLTPVTTHANQAIEDLKEHFVNTSDVSEALLFEPDFRKHRPIVTINYRPYDVRTQRWQFDVGFPHSTTRLREPSEHVVYVKPKRATSSPSNPQNPRYYTSNLMQVLDLLYQKGRQSIRQLQAKLGRSFYKTRQILETIRLHELCYDRFNATLGSTLSTLFVLIQNVEERTISRLTTFFTYLPEQITVRVRGDITGILSYVRVPHEYQQETMHAIEKITHPHQTLVMPLIGAQDIRWRLPWERWDEKHQCWKIKQEDFALVDTA